VQSLGTDASAVFPENMLIEFVKDATVSGSADVYERLVRYCDERVSMLVLGATLTTGTSNTGSGGSQALGRVHAEVRADILRADASQLSATLMRDLVRPFVRLNYGDAAAVPVARLAVEEPEDLAAEAEIVERLSRAGVRLRAQEVREYFGYSEPAAGEEVVVGAAAPATPAAPASAALAHTAAATAAVGQASQRDALDDAIDAEADAWTAALADIENTLAKAATGATGFADLQARIAAAVSDLPPAQVEALRDVFANLQAKGAVAGAAGLDLTTGKLDPLGADDAD